MTRWSVATKGLAAGVLLAGLAVPAEPGWAFDVLDGLRPADFQTGGLAARPLNIRFQVCFGVSRLRAPVSLGVSAVSSRTVMNNVG